MSPPTILFSQAYKDDLIQSSRYCKVKWALVLLSVAQGNLEISDILKVTWQVRDRAKTQFQVCLISKACILHMSLLLDAGTSNGFVGVVAGTTYSDSQD